MNTCIACGKEHRVDRMSNHILKHHRDNLLNVSTNKAVLTEIVKWGIGVVGIFLHHPDDIKRRERYYVSFGYTSGWSMNPLSDNRQVSDDRVKDTGMRSKPIALKVKEKIKENKEEHLKVCKDLLDLISKKEEVHTDNEDTSQAYMELMEKYAALKANCEDLMKRNVKLEEEKKELKAEIEEKEEETSDMISRNRSVQKCIERVFNIRKDDIDDITAQVNDLYDEYRGEDEWDRLQKELLKVDKYDY
jgi:hypothetical protein